MECRAGEPEKSWFRSNRIYNMGGQWYFTTREHQEIGPFSSRKEAERETGVFLRCLQEEGLLAAQYYTSMRRRMGVSRFQP